MRLSKLSSKGQAQGGIALVLGVVVVVVALFIGMFLYVEVGQAIPRDGNSSFTAGMNATFDNISQNTDSGFNLAAIIPIVLVAFAIIGILTGVGFSRRS